MVISQNSQLGLRFRDNEIKADFLRLMKDYVEKELGLTKSVIDKLVDLGNKGALGDIDATATFSDEEKRMVKEDLDIISAGGNTNKIRDLITDLVGERDIISDEDSSYYLICDSIYKVAELIRIKEWFSGRTLKDIKFGKYTYLMGKSRMVRFMVVAGAIKGFYYDTENKIAFEWGLEMENGDYYFSHHCSKEFTEIMKVLTFVELGDIKVKMLEAGLNNGAPKNKGKITNTSNRTVYVVDSNWNTIVIRTDGFAVRGHFRLQPYGPMMKDRKLIWIDAFEKHGYKRRPTGEIVN